MNFELYKKQVELLINVLPEVNKQESFALKGGTAINLFFCNMPRLSIDIDLAYLPIEPRDIFIKNVTRSLNGLEEIVRKKYKVKKIYNKDQLTKLIVIHQGVEVKIEPNIVLRGYVFPPETHELCEAAQDTFLQSIKIRTLSYEDIYAGKICAALDRQHPRDLFDVNLLLEKNGFTEKLRKAFIVYLASSSRPMYELLSPNLLNINKIFATEFSGMTTRSITCKDLENTRIQLIRLVNTSLTLNERKFLLSFKEGTPDWKLLSLPSIEKLPALQWKLLNIQKMDKEKRTASFKKLEKALMG